MRGWHVGFILRDNTLLMVRVQTSPNIPKGRTTVSVVGFEVGPRGAGILEKGELLKLEQAGKLAYPTEMTCKQFR